MVRVSVVALLTLLACGSSSSLPGADAAAPEAAVEAEAGPPTGTATLLSDPSVYPYGIAVDDGWVYFTSSVAGTLSRFPKSGGAPVTLAANMPNAGRIVLDGSFAYVAVRGTADAYVDGAVMRIAKDGSTAVALASNLHLPDGLVLDGADLYVACSGSNQNGSYAGDGAIVRMAADGSTPSEVLLTNEAYPADVVTDAASVYFTTRYGGTVSACTKSACGATRKDLFTGLDEPVSLALATGASGPALLFAAYHGGSVLLGATDGSSSTTLQPSRGLPHDVAFAGGNAYWLETLTLEVNRQPLDPSMRFTTLVKTTQDPSVLAYDGADLFVTDEHAGTITRTPL